jgi:DNA polymerase epsilon subunit 1
MASALLAEDSTSCGCEEELRIGASSGGGALGSAHFLQSSQQLSKGSGTPTFVLSDVQCPACSACRDIDVARDEHLSMSAAAGWQWRCPCGAPYDTAAMEGALVAALEKASLAFQGQDLVCGKCFSFRASAVRRNCECSGSYSTLVPAVVFNGALATFRRIADKFGFAWLKETVGWLEQA